MNWYRNTQVKYILFKIYINCWVKSNSSSLCIKSYSIDYPVDGINDSETLKPGDLRDILVTAKTTYKKRQKKGQKQNKNEAVPYPKSKPENPIPTSPPTTL